MDLDPSTRLGLDLDLAGPRSYVSLVRTMCRLDLLIDTPTPQTELTSIKGDRSRLRFNLAFLLSLTGS